MASWYGEDFHGKATSSGEIYDMHGISAAHKILPMHTWVRVRNLATGKSLAVRINDRGPFVAGRIIDLSVAAAKELGFTFGNCGSGN
ncbi:MAG: septal ring lytic transglycosylase RlpA family protein [Desulfobacterales bacterium]